MPNIYFSSYSFRSVNLTSPVKRTVVPLNFISFLVTPISWTVTGRSHFSRIFFSGLLVSLKHCVYIIIIIRGKILNIIIKSIYVTRKPYWFELVCWLVYGVQRHFQKYFSYIVAVSFITGGNQSTRRKQPTCHKTLTNLIT